ncbi:MAG: hypothetical protein ABEI78_02165, partial [Candidatus Nanohaloarchaea archaeon]
IKINCVQGNFFLKPLKKRFWKGVTSKMADLDLKQIDFLFLGGSLGALLIISYLLRTLGKNIMVIEAYTRFIVTAIALAAIFFMYKAIKEWAGDLARYLQTIAIGIAILMISWIPHIGWHVKGMPPVMGMPPAFWLTFFHGLAIIGFGFQAYGYYLFWKKA